VIAAAHLLRQPALYLCATAPLLLAGALSVLAWWRTCRPARLVLLRLLWRATLVVDAVLVANSGAVLYWYGWPIFLLFQSGPLALAALFTAIVWRHTRGLRGMASGLPRQDGR
jgi:hypothetical protein